MRCVWLLGAIGRGPANAPHFSPLCHRLRRAGIRLIRLASNTSLPCSELTVDQFWRGGRCIIFGFLSCTFIAIPPHIF